MTMLTGINILNDRFDDQIGMRCVLPVGLSHGGYAFYNAEN